MLMPSNPSSSNYNANLTLASGKDAVIAIEGQQPAEVDPNLQYVKTKDLDTVSIASSMHFTMVNGEGGPPKKPKRGLCDRGRQVTVLIVSMSTIFMLLIMGMVYALESKFFETAISSDWILIIVSFPLQCAPATCPRARTRFLCLAN